MSSVKVNCMAHETRRQLVRITYSIYFLERKLATSSVTCIRCNSDFAINMHLQSILHHENNSCKLACKLILMDVI